MLSLTRLDRNTYVGKFSKMVKITVAKSDCYKVYNIDKVVLACCALHNFLRRKCSNTYTPNDVFDVEDTITGNITLGLRTHSDNLLDLQNGYNRNHSAEAKEVREQFKIYFNNSGKVSWQEKMVSH